jgi:hypothetical protein
MHFLILFTVNADCFHKRCSLIRLYNSDGVRFLWSMNCIFICYLRYAVHLLECVKNCVISLWGEIRVCGPFWKQCWRGYLDVRRILYYYYFIGGLVVVLWSFVSFSKWRIHVKWVRLRTGYREKYLSVRQGKFDGQCTYKPNVEVRSRNYCYCGKAINITYSECVSVAWVIQPAMHIRCAIFISIACLALPYFSTLSHKR